MNKSGYPGYRNIADRMRQFFGIADPQQNVQVQMAAVVADISPPHFYTAMYDVQAATTSNYSFVGIGIDATLFEGTAAEVTNLKAYTTGTSVIVAMTTAQGNLTDAGWSKFGTLVATTSGKNGASSGIFRVKRTETSGIGAPAQTICNGIPVPTNTWVDMPGTYVLEPGGVLYLRTSALNTGIRMMADLRLLEVAGVGM